MAAMGVYHRYLWNKAHPLFQHLHGHLRDEGQALYAEAMRLSQQERIAARHVIVASSRQSMCAVALRRHAWLRAATLPDAARKQVENLPFEGTGLFHPKTDEIMKEHQDMKKTVRSYNFPHTSRASQSRR